METNVEQPFFTDEVINQLISITTEKGIMSFLLDNLKIFLNRYPQDLEVHSSINEADAHYRVSVSAHGTDMVVMHNPAVSTDSSVEFLFQQPRHNCSAFAYSGLLPRIKKNVLRLSHNVISMHVKNYFFKTIYSQCIRIQWCYEVSRTII